MKVAYFDCISGISGDMVLGALIDSGLSTDDLIDGLGSLKISGFTLKQRQVLKNGFRAVKVDVDSTDQATERRLSEIVDIIEGSSLPKEIKQEAVTIFNRLGSVEANIHGVEQESVHLHELGGLDTIIDIVGTLIGITILGIERIFASPIPLGRGFVKGAHGPIPIPAPATLALLIDVPVVGKDIKGELVTPTGAVLITSLAEAFGPIPDMRLCAVGYGAGGRDLPVPNVLRLLLGEQPTTTHLSTETLITLETNIDDLNPEIFAYFAEQLYESGALDVTLTPIQMKKNRPGTLVSVLCQPENEEKLSSILFIETSTLGIRKQLVERKSLERNIHKVDTLFGAVRVKISHYGGKVIKVSPEFEDCRVLAKSQSVPIREIYHAAEVVARERFLKP
ncbi:MAG: nickel pincer cofactor biosynthesis protein LarC [Anaerolineales bacterium]|jgi:hypothetical protein